MSYCGPTLTLPLHRPAIFASYFHPHRGEIPFFLYRERRQDPHPVRSRARIGILDGIRFRELRSNAMTEFMSMPASL